MPTVVYRLKDGRLQSAAAECGSSVMSAAVANRVPGILGDCGGAQACGTCIVAVAPEWIRKFSPKAGDEAGLLEGCDHPEEAARLGCQLILSDAHDGLLVDVIGE